MTIPIIATLKRRSALQTFTECQYRWDQLYRQGVVDESPEAKRGTTFHACAKLYIQALFAAREASNPELARVAYTAGIVESPCPAHLLDEVYDLFWRWAEKFELDTDAYLLSEENPPDPDGYSLRIDLAYAKGDVLEMPDWKTHYAIWSEARVRDAFQAKFYAARARRIWPGFQIYRFVMVFVRFGVSVPVEYTAADLDRVDTHVLAIEEAQTQALARGGTFLASAGDHCGYCSLTCPLIENMPLDPIRATALDEARNVGAEYIALVQAVKARRDVLSQFTAINGSVDVGGVVFGHKPTERTHYSGAGVVDALRNVGVAPIFTIGKTAIKSFLTAKKWSFVRADLEDLAVTETTTRFGTTRAAVSDESADDEQAEA